MTNQVTGFVVHPGAGQTINGPAGGLLTFKARTEDTGGTLTVFENIIAPKDGPPLHKHAREDEAWYILEGHLRFKSGDELFDAPAGSFVFIPRGTPHCFQNIGDEPARIMVLFTPSGMERFFDQFAELSPEAVGPEAFHTIGRDSGMEVLGPPLGVSDPL